MLVRRDHSIDRAVWQAWNEIAEAVADCSAALELGQHVIDAIGRLVDFDLGSILSAVPGQDWSTEGQKGDCRIVCQNQWQYASEVSRDEIRLLATRFSLDTELFRSRRRDEASVYRDFVVPNRQVGFVTRYWTMDGHLWGVGLSRGSRTFSKRDQARLNALFPQIRASLRLRRLLSDDGLGYPGAGHGGPWSLTAAEERTMSLVVRGFTNREVAGLLRVSPNTVRNTLAQVFRKVGVSRRSELVYIVQNSTDTDVLRGARSGPSYQRHLYFANILKGSPSPLSADPRG